MVMLMAHFLCRDIGRPLGGANLKRNTPHMALYKLELFKNHPPPPPPPPSHEWGNFLSVITMTLQTAHDSRSVYVKPKDRENLTHKD